MPNIEKSTIKKSTDATVESLAKNITTKKTDEELLLASLENQEYFAELFERYRIILLRYIKRIAYPSDEIAEEILQDVFIKIWKNIHDFDTSMKFSSWAYRIAHNESMNTLRRNKKHVKHRYTGTLDIDQISNNKNEIQEIISQTQDNIQLARSMEKLPIKYKEILILRFWEQKEYHEISEILKKPKNTIGTLIRRAKLALKEILLKDWK